MTSSDHPDAKRQLEGEAMSMRERIARALFEKISRPMHGKDWDAAQPGTRDHWLSAADTVLAALVEPTAAMTEAYWDAVCAYCGHTETEAFPLAADIWKAMIAEASK